MYVVEGVKDTATIDWTRLRADYHTQLVRRGLGSLGEGGLAPLEAQIYSQMGEDGVIAGILERLDATEPGSFLDIGAGERGHGISNTRALAERGWSGVLLDADENEVARLRTIHAGRPVRAAAALVSQDNIAQLCKQLDVAKDLTLVSIDVDGDDLWIWSRLPRRARIVVIEYNSSLPLDSIQAQPANIGPWRVTDFFGASLGAVEWLAGRLGYALVHTDAINAFLVRVEDAQRVMHGASPVRRPVFAPLPPDTTGRTYIDPRDEIEAAAPLLARHHEVLKWGTHTPLLAAAVAMASAGLPVLELGCGRFSTPLLLAMCAATGRELVSADNSAQGLASVEVPGLDMRCEHTVIHATDWDATIGALAQRRWGVVFVDHWPPARRGRDAVLLAEHAELLVLHDSLDPACCYNLGAFAHVTHDDRFFPRTSMVSQTRRFHGRLMSQDRVARNWVEQIAPRVVIECGAHHGEDTAWMATVADVVHAIEADPRNEPPQELLTRGNVRWTRAAVSDHEGEADFWLSQTAPDRTGTWTESSSLREPREHLRLYPGVTFDGRARVRTVTIDAYCQREKIESVDLLWADIQGAEDLMLAGAEQTLARTSWLILEVSVFEVYTGQKLRSEIIAWLAQRGWQFVAVESETTAPMALFVSKARVADWRVRVPF